MTIGELPNLSDNNMRVEIENYLGALQRLGMEVLVIDTRHPALQVPAIYTIVPGAHFRERSMVQNVGLFVAKLVHEQIDDLVEQSRQLMRLREFLPEAYYLEFYLGKNLMAVGQHDQALKHFELALARHPEAEDLPYLYSFMGDCLKEMGRYEEALAALYEGLSHDEERPDLHNLAGFCHFKLGDHAAAVLHFARTVELNPASAIDYANLGVNLRKLGRFDEAVAHLSLALELDPSLDFARTHLAALTGDAKA